MSSNSKGGCIGFIIYAIVITIVICLVCRGCADEKTFTKADGTNIVCEPYGWGNYQSKKQDNVVYEVNVGNVVLSILFSETIVVPVYLTGWQLFEAVKMEDTIDNTPISTEKANE